MITPRDCGLILWQASDFDVEHPGAGVQDAVHERLVKIAPEAVYEADRNPYLHRPQLVRPA
jgi:hypothetical protein